MIRYFQTCRGIFSALYILYMSKIHYFSYIHIKACINYHNEQCFMKNNLIFNLQIIFLPFCFYHISTSGFFELLFQNFIFCFQLNPKFEEKMFLMSVTLTTNNLLNQINHKKCNKIKKKKMYSFIFLIFTPCSLWTIG